MNLTDAQARVLRQLPRRHGLDLMKFRSVDGRNATIDALIRKGFLDEMPNNYAPRLVAITPAGRAALKEWEKENATN